MHDAALLNGGCDQGIIRGHHLSDHMMQILDEETESDGGKAD